jgi:hypothetical protein
MWKIGDKLRQEFEVNARVWGTYEESLKGTVGKINKLHELHRLRKENAAARRSFLYHKQHCAVCSTGPRQDS